MESLDIKELFQNTDLSSRLQSISWKKLVEMIKYKCKWYAKKFIQINQWFPSSKICSQCGYYYKDLIDKEKWTCPHCQTHHDRDINAAKNIKKEELRLLMDETFVNLRNWGDSTVILLSWESNGPRSKNPRHLYVEVVQSLEKEYIIENLDDLLCQYPEKSECILFDKSFEPESFTAQEKREGKKTMFFNDLSYEEWIGNMLKE